MIEEQVVEEAVPRFRYLPWLDGLRAASIFLVLGTHRMGALSARIAGPLAGWSGVDVFFVISGFLVTSLLVQEAAARGGRFSFIRFWLRRVLRIAPAYYTFLGAFLLFYGPEALRAVLTSAVYLVDYDSALGWNRLGQWREGYLGHLWSLAVEEQFYLTWPMVLALLLRGARAVPITFGLILIVNIWRAILIMKGVGVDRLYLAFDTRVDAILLGCLASLLWNDGAWRRRLCLVLNAPIVPWLVLLALAFSAHGLGAPKGRGLPFWLVALPLHQALVALLILSLCVAPGSFPASLLGSRLPVYLGRLSYSLYLWHRVVFTEIDRLLPGQSDWLMELIRCSAVLICATLSYKLVEQPFLRLKGRFAERRRTGEATDADHLAVRKPASGQHVA